MSIRDWPPKKEPKQEVIKFLTPETIQDISDRIIGVEQLKAILLSYSGGIFKNRSEITKDTIDSAVQIFLIKYADIYEYKKDASPYNAEELLAEFPDIKEDMKAFKTIMYGKDGNISYQLKPKADPEAVTQELPPLPDAPDFQRLSGSQPGSVKKVEEIPDTPNFKTLSTLKPGEAKQVESLEDKN